MKNRLKPYKREWTIEVLHELKKGPNNSSALTKVLKKSQATIHKQLNILEEEGYVKSKKIKMKNITLFELTKKAVLLLNYLNDKEEFDKKYKEILK